MLIAAPTFTDVLPVTAAGQLAAGSGVVVVTQQEGARATLLVGVDGAAPSPVVGAGPVPAWAQPHVGTDHAGRRIVIYPVCSGGVRTCDLVGLDPVRRRTRTLWQISRPGGGEIEGAMERGSAVVARWTRGLEPQPDAAETAARFEHIPTMLLYRPAGGALRILTRHGGQQLALHGRQIAQVRDRNPAAGSCGSPALEVLTTTGARRVVRQYRCGEDGHSPGGAAWFGGRLVWLMFGFTPAFSETQLGATPGQIRTQHVRDPSISAYAPISRSTAYVLRSTWPVGMSEQRQLVRVSHIRPVAGG